jgi:hypothetical protein
MRGGCPDARQAAKRQTAVHSRVQTRRCRPGAYFRAGRSPRSPASLASTTPRSATGCAKTPSTVASVRAQHQLRDDLELVQRYGRDEAADHFGGCYWDNEPPVTIVALFTAEVDRHRTVLRSRVSQPARLASTESASAFARAVRGLRGHRALHRRARRPHRRADAAARGRCAAGRAVPRRLTQRHTSQLGQLFSWERRRAA